MSELTSDTVFKIMLTKCMKNDYKYTHAFIKYCVQEVVFRTSNFG